MSKKIIKVIHNFLDMTSIMLYNETIGEFMLKKGLNECTNAEYHADRTHLSSSVIKTLYKDLAQYHKEYILGEKPEFKNKAALEEGSLAHSLILEPHLTNSEYIFWDGWTKRGTEWDNFKATAPEGKTIISAPQKNRVDRLIQAYNTHPIAKNFISGGKAEETLAHNFLDVPIKVRFDYINVEKGFIADVKTTGFGSDIDSFKVQADGLMYELSAALYCTIAEMHYGKPFDFYFIVLSKKEFSCDVFKASTQFKLSGLKKIKIALEKYKKALQTGIWIEENLKVENEETEYTIQEI